MPSGDFHRNKTECPKGHPYDKANTHWKRNRHGNLGRCCRECQKIRMQEKRKDPKFLASEAAKTRRWRDRNPEKYRQGWERAHEDKKQILLDARKGGCIECGEKHPACLDFHHRDGRDKLGHIGHIRRFGMDKLLAEIAKCDVLCANCHRKHHYDERQKKQAA